MKHLGIGRAFDPIVLAASFSKNSCGERRRCEVPSRQAVLSWCLTLPSALISRCSLESGPRAIYSIRFSPERTRHSPSAWKTRYKALGDEGIHSRRSCWCLYCLSQNPMCYSCTLAATGNEDKTPHTSSTSPRRCESFAPDTRR
jgi:hypothetical protein